MIKGGYSQRLRSTLLNPNRIVMQVVIFKELKIGSLAIDKREKKHKKELEKSIFYTKSIAEIFLI